MSKFNYDDIVQVTVDSGIQPALSRKAWVVGIFEKSLGSHFDQFPPGVVYSVEFENGSATDVHEDNLEIWE